LFKKHAANLLIERRNAPAGQQIVFLAKETARHNKLPLKERESGDK
jgi:hypothetical protein